MNENRCPSCQSLNVVKINKWLMAVMIASIGIGIFPILGLLFFPLLIGIPISLILAVVFAIFGSSMYHCGSCGYKWIVERKQK